MSAYLKETLASTSKLHSRNPKAVTVFLALVFLLFWKNIIYDVCTHFTGQYKSIEVVDKNPIKNETLGFQEIFVLSLPERGDRRKPLLAAANATNLNITVLDAIRDRQIPVADYPEWWGTNNWVPKEGELGCLMSHLRTWRKMIHEGITSALILESDVDWDIRIKDSMVGLGEGVKAIADWPFEIPSHPRDFSKEVSPYGDRWDLVWLGHCGSNADGNGRIYAFNDASAPDEEHAWSFGGSPSPGHRPPGTRIVYQFQKSVCTTGYAISNQGARKLEKHFRQANSPIDLKMWDHCVNDPELACLGVWPQIISMAESKTNIKHTEGGLSFGHEITDERIVAGNGIQISARVNANAGTAGDPSKWKSEFKNGEKKKEEKKEDEKKKEEKKDENNDSQE
ncbi:hypothetical protein OEA41_005143 [Lepraria neglecta]|uniref:Glycosyl transferase family 25 domain-containing protein n=1 Tax=Lepraria neglecta TaxID=209136 RepID=A0AAD9YZ79_9LECA|nr:hypothetical protein OEA41_005143 [Lepraria neglecta]